ncbi:uncharacterized protein PGTG_10391 [Puccinia graminis f. sp. tritici CRL 75-36-700-3]|uniref:Myb/SANT-like domain-containing protein n=1 Tax=Puccinia graminis f. sp. tritici (strain CRL 75-36-700-3 / race SCCL) TaxID=418459 RepID=E3KKU5_PUCGT|nr:uncharacterized protein PGTG_10391 [Puccinia graminis f. sp. tritici CRL 75-36-700-3]EFP84920.1 hypothetical protein PGTG_10391 [Puccinia graminis f. sp. tritici CRL 75-36-700-3]
MIDPSLFDISPPAHPSDGSDDQLPPLPPPLRLSPEDEASKRRQPPTNTAKMNPKASSTTPKPSATTPKQSATPKTPAMTSKSPAINSKSLQESATSDGNAPHTWSTLKKCKLLELLYDEMSAGHATDNGNLKKEGWTGVMNGLNDYFNLKLTRDQIKNQKNAIRSLFFDYKFLCEQSGFGWDNKKFTVTADQRTWDELIQAHPRRNFGKLKDKPFPIYELAERVFVGNFATGESVNKHVPPDEVPVKVPNDSNPEANLTNPTPTSKKRKSQKKKDIVVSSSSDSDSDVRVSKKQSESTSRKRVRETKGTVVTKGIEGLVGAINNASNTIANLNKEGTSSKDDQPNGTTPSNQDSLNAQALKLLSSYFLNKVDDEIYIRYVWVLEDEKRRQHSYR